MNLSEALRILELHQNPTIAEIKKAFRNKAKAFHPDHNLEKDADNNFIKAYHAYQYLIDGKNQNQPLKPNTKSNPHFRNQNHYQRHQEHDREWFAETFEERLKNAKAEAERLENERSQKIYNTSFYEYKHSWQRKIIALIAVVSLVCISIFSFEKFQTPRITNFNSNEYQVLSDDPDKPTYFFIEIDNQTIEIEPEMYLLLKKEECWLMLYQTPILHDVVKIKALNKATAELYTFQLPINIYNSFPLIQIILIIPFLSFFVERPKFNFVFIHVYFSLIIVPILLIFLWFSSNRFFRLLELY